MENLDIRLAIEEAGFQFKDIAHQIGIHKCSFSRIMRYPLSTENKIRILKAIDEMKGGQKHDVNNY